MRSLGKLTYSDVATRLVYRHSVHEPFCGYDSCDTGTHIYRYTGTLVHRYTNTLVYKYTGAQVH